MANAANVQVKEVESRLTKLNDKVLASVALPGDSNVTKGVLTSQISALRQDL